MLSFFRKKEDVVNKDKQLLDLKPLSSIKNAKQLERLPNGVWIKDANPNIAGGFVKLEFNSWADRYGKVSQTKDLQYPVILQSY